MADDDSEGLRTRRRKLVDQALRALTDAHAELESLVAIQRQLTDDARRLSKVATELSHAIPHTEAELRNTTAWQQLQEMNTSFSLMYLQIHQQMQEESRRFTLIANVLKTRHDTAKNSISNIR
jgi:hypothetical protein